MMFLFSVPQNLRKVDVLSTSQLRSGIATIKWTPLGIPITSRLSMSTSPLRTTPDLALFKIANLFSNGVWLKSKRVLITRSVWMVVFLEFAGMLKKLKASLVLP